MESDSEGRYASKKINSWQIFKEKRPSILASLPSLHSLVMVEKQ
jgi:hypothetical protein